MVSREQMLELVFTKLALVYGRDFLSKWEGLDMGEVKADWKRELGAVLSSPVAIQFALENLPADRVPNVIQFRSLCMDAPRNEVPELLTRDIPKPTPEEKARVRALLEKARASLTGAQR